MPIDPKFVDVLKFIAREEPLASTLAAHPHLTRDTLRAGLEGLCTNLSEPSRSANGRASSTSLRVRLYSDGAARGNPGPSGAGAVLMDPSGQVIDRLGKYL